LALGLSGHVAGDVIHTALTVKPKKADPDDLLNPTFLSDEVGQAQEASLDAELNQKLDEFASLLKRSRGGDNLSLLSDDEFKRMRELEVPIDEDDKLSRVGNEAYGAIIDRATLHDEIEVLEPTRAYGGYTWTLKTGAVRASATGYSVLDSAMDAATIVAQHNKYGAIVVAIDDRYFVTSPSMVSEGAPIPEDYGEAFDSLNVHSRTPESRYVVGIADRHGRSTLFQSADDDMND
jgi:hypothetical protein